MAALRASTVAHVNPVSSFPGHSNQSLALRTKMKSGTLTIMGGRELALPASYQSGTSRTRKEPPVKVEMIFAGYAAMLIFSLFTRKTCPRANLTKEATYD